MPNPEEGKEKEAKASAITETAEGGVEVPVDEIQEEVATQETTVTEEPKEDKKEPARQDPIKNKVFAHDRILSNIQRDIEAIRLSMQQNSSTGQVTQEQGANLTDIDKLAQTDWKAAVNKLSELKFQELRQKEQHDIERVTQETLITQKMETNSQAVLSRHPELNEADSEKSQLFQGILNQHPDWRTSPEGPLLTMYEMENQLRSKGYDVDHVVAKKVEEEQNRIAKAQGNALAASRLNMTSGKVVLTKEQKDFCDFNGISYEEYARTLRQTGAKMGVEA